LNAGGAEILQVDEIFSRRQRRLGRLTEGCNACHATTDHAFVVIKVPSASAFPNQDFETKR